MRLTGRFESVSEIETVAEDHFGYQMVRGVRHSDAQTEIHFPFRRKVQIDGRKKLVLLLASRKKIGGRPDSSVVLEAPRDSLCEVVAELEIGRERHALVDTIPMKRPVKSRIEREVPRANLLIDDGPHLPGPCVCRIPAPLIANLVRKAEAHGPVPLFRNAHPRTNVVTDPVPSLAILRGSENVETGLEPVSETVRDFDGLVQLVIGGKQAVLECL